MIQKLATIDHLAVNKWLVQICKGGVWYTEYFMVPPTGPHDVLRIYPSKEAAILACLEKVQ